MPRLSPPAIAVALASFAAVPAAGLAQEATPTYVPADPAECQIEPRSVGFYEDAVRRAVASPPAPPTFPPGGGTVYPSPIAVTEEGSQPADAETVAAVRATAREFYSCVNAGDLRRMLALYTEQAARENLAFLLSVGIARSLEEGTPVAVLEAELVEAYEEFATTSATPMAEGEQVPQIDVANVRVLADRRVAADLVLAGFPGRDRWLFATEGNRYLIVGTLAADEDGTPTVATTVP